MAKTSTASKAINKKFMLRNSISLFFALSLFFGLSIKSQAQYAHTNKDILSVIDEIEEQTDYRFLYRSALLADIKINISATESTFFEELNIQLSSHDLTSKVDKERKQVIILRNNNKTSVSKEVAIKGQILDETTGERLPYAIVTWQKDGKLKGVTSNESGVFSIERIFEGKSIEITASSFGYSPDSIHLDISANSDFDDLTFRLKRKRIDVSQLIVIGSNYSDDLNPESSEILDIGDFSPMGDNSSVSALQFLPSVSLSTLMSGELQVRGSPADGFRVLVDDITIYNQSHLYGLVDSFNGDILQRGGFYYDIAPVKIQAPPGGTLSLITKTGSLDKFSGSAGISNSSLRFSLDGPIKKGKSSWLISARRSYLNNLNWFNNEDLIKWGLNVNRPQNSLPSGIIDLDSYLVRSRNTEASFYDLHGKIYFEGNSGNRLTISGYLGGDDTGYSAERLFRSTSTSDPFTYRPVSTSNDWQNGAVSAKYNQWLNDDIYSSTILGASIYTTTFSQDDFTYIKSNTNSQSINAFIFPYENENVLNDFKAEQLFEINSSQSWFWSAGATYNYYLGEYSENSFDRPGYFTSVSAHKIDLFTQVDFSGLNENLDIFAGSRVHYYSNGEYLKFSPRIKFKFFPQSKISVGIGYSKNYQFLNQISLSNTITSDVWILADEKQAPTSLNYYSSGIYFSQSKLFYAQAEAYIKEFKNVRLHEINTFSLSNTYASNPWFTNNEGMAKGIEFLLRSEFKTIQLSQTYSLSEVKLSNPLINNGDSFYADWDRTFKYSAILSIQPLESLSAHISWNFASGTPNKLATFGPQPDKRLSNYKRTDFSIEYQRSYSKYDLSLSASLFNVFDTQNVWYKDLSIVLDQNSMPNQITTSPIDIYDVGIQPSFNISIGF
ncbi:MAG: carboxypeptidase-like regulatory domain-containing protein [Balneola sp.]